MRRTWAAVSPGCPTLTMISLFGHQTSTTSESCETAPAARATDRGSRRPASGAGRRGSMRDSRRRSSGRAVDRPPSPPGQPAREGWRSRGRSRFGFVGGGTPGFRGAGARVARQEAGRRQRLRSFEGAFCLFRIAELVGEDPPELEGGDRGAPDPSESAPGSPSAVGAPRSERRPAARDRRARTAPRSDASGRGWRGGSPEPRRAASVAEPGDRTGVPTTESGRFGRAGRGPAGADPGSGGLRRRGDAWLDRLPRMNLLTVTADSARERETRGSPAQNVARSTDTFTMRLRRTARGHDRHRSIRALVSISSAEVQVTDKGFGQLPSCVRTAHRLLLAAVITEQQGAAGARPRRCASSSWRASCPGASATLSSVWSARLTENPRQP